MLLVGPHGSELALKVNTPIEQLVDLPLILTTRPNSLRRMVELKMNDHDMKPHSTAALGRNRSITIARISLQRSNIPQRIIRFCVSRQPDGIYDRWGIGARRFGRLAGLVAALQVDDGTRSAWAASSIRGETQPWNIMPDWMCQ
jgi:hypothetical protein